MNSQFNVKHKLLCKHIKAGKNGNKSRNLCKVHVNINGKGLMPNGNQLLT